MMHAVACRLGMHAWKMTGGTCSDGWVWVTDVCSRCGTFRNPYMATSVDIHNEWKGGAK